jgi:hypothetical protein
MMSNDSRHENEITELARLLPVPAERDLPANRGQTLKEHLMTEFRMPDEVAERAIPRAIPRTALRSAARWRSWKKSRVLVAVAGAGAVAAVAASIGLTASVAPAPQSSPAALLLARIADAAARQPVPVVRDDQYVYLKSVGAFQNFVNGQPVPMGKPNVSQLWLSVSNVCAPGLAIVNGERIPLVTTPPVKGLRRGKCPSTGGLGNPTYRFLQSVPTDPSTLLNLIYAAHRGQLPPNEEAFTTIGDTLRGSIAPPQVTAALYRAAALIPGVTVIPHVVGALGRAGVAVAYTYQGTRTEWIFDTTTLEWLGELDISTVTGAVTGESAVIARGFVDHPGQLP